MSGLPDFVYYRFRYGGKPLGEGKSTRKLQATALAIIEKRRTLIGVRDNIDTEYKKERSTYWRKELKMLSPRSRIKCGEAFPQVGVEEGPRGTFPLQHSR